MDIGINGGFDIVIGNPPYGATFDQNMKNYIRKNFDSYEYKYESYVYFMEKSLDLELKVYHSYHSTFMAKTRQNF